MSSRWTRGRARHGDVVRAERGEYSDRVRRAGLENEKAPLETGAGRRRRGGGDVDVEKGRGAVAAAAAEGDGGGGSGGSGGGHHGDGCRGKE